MKNLFILFLLVLGFQTVFSKNYYIAANGNDANSGTSITAPWKSISKLNASFAAVLPGDSILFRSGDIFYGAIVATKSGASTKPIVFSSYGSGAKPVITGFVAVSAWTSVGNGIYQSYVPAAKTTLNMVVMNDVPQALGRYPNIDAGNGGYLNYETFGTSSITDNQLTSATNWTGAEVVIRKKLWVLDRCKVTAHSGGTVSYTNIGSTYTGTNGFGYFFQNDARTLDKPGEWYLNKSTHYIQMYFGTASPSAYTVKVSYLDTLLNLSSRTYINVSNLAFEGANGYALFSSAGNYVNIQNCSFNNSGVGAISASSTSNLLIENCLVQNSLSNAITASSSRSVNVTIRGCVVKNTGAIPGMAQSGGNSCKGIMASASSNLLIEYNSVDTTGYVGIDWQGNNVNVRYNVVNYFDFIKDDAGGIYTYTSGTDASPGTIYTNRTVSNNIVMNGIGAPNGRNSATLFVSGIYLDGRTMNVNVLNNTVFNMGKNGIHTNNPQNITIRGNTLYNNLNAVSCARWASFGNISNLQISNNIMYPKLETQRSVYYVNTGLNEPVATTVNAALRGFATVDSNIYGTISQAGIQSEIYASTGGALVATSPYALEGWRAATAHDMLGKNAAKSPSTYTITGLVGGNKFLNGTFSTTISGFSILGSTVSGLWDNTGKISGGSLKVSVATPSANKYSTLLAPLGAVSSAKKYVLRFATYGTTNQGVLRAYIRKTASPYTSLVPIQVRSFGTGRKDHEFLFNAPVTDAGASFVIEIEQTSGTTYIDNVEFYEATATLRTLDSQLRIEYNPTKVTKTIALDGTYIGVTGIVYNGSVTLQPFTSAILVKDSATTARAAEQPVTDSLKAAATAVPVACFGSSTTVTVSASGGREPYTGTGIFNVNAGRGSLKLSFPVSTAGKYTSLYYGVGSVRSDKNYVLKFSTLGTTGNGIVRAGIRQTYTPWGTITERQISTFGNVRKDHEFIFKAPPAEANASFLIEVDQSSGTTYIDNIAFFECDTAGKILSNNLYAYGQFETGIANIFTYSGNGNHIAEWDTTSKINATYYYTVRDADSAVSVAPVTISQPSAPLSVTATAGLISIVGGTTSVTVSATGGTAPYTGTGTFSSLLPGTYTYTVTDALGCTASQAVSVLPFTAAKPSGGSTAARTSASNTISSAGELQLTATPNPFSGSFTLQVRGGTDAKLVLSVYSIDCRMMYQTSGSSNKVYSFGNSIVPGIYIVKVQQGDVVQTLKVVKTD